MAGLQFTRSARKAQLKLCVGFGTSCKGHGNDGHAVIALAENGDKGRRKICDEYVT